MQPHLDLHNRVRVQYGWQGLSAGRGCFERRVIPKGYCHSSRPSRAPHRYSCSPAARPRRLSPGLDRRHPRHGRQLLRPQRVLQGIRDPVNRGAIGQVASSPINAEPPRPPGKRETPATASRSTAASACDLRSDPAVLQLEQRLPVLLRRWPPRQERTGAPAARHRSSALCQRAAGRYWRIAAAVPVGWDVTTNTGTSAA